MDNVELIYQPVLAPGNYALVVKNISNMATAYGMAWHSLPAVAVAATIPTAREIDSQAGFVTFTRTGNTTLPLLVPLTIGGTAVPGTHYQSLPTQITIAAGSATATLQVTPVSDSLAEGDRTVTVAVAADFQIYEALAGGNLNNPPLSSPAWWRVLGYTETAYNAATVYNLNDTCSGNQHLSVAGRR